MEIKSRETQNKSSTNTKGVSRAFVLFVGLITLSLAVGGGVFLFQAQSQQGNLAQSLVQSADSIRLNHLKTAWVILKELPTPEKKNPLFSDWYHQVAVVSIGLKMTDRLAILKGMDPVRFSECEGAESALLEGSRAKNKPSAKSTLGSFAKDDAGQDSLFLNKADQLWIQGDKENAIILLQGTKARGVVEVRRLLRLAILCENDNALFAEYLKQAVGEAFRQLAVPPQSSTDEVLAHQRTSNPNDVTSEPSSVRINAERNIPSAPLKEINPEANDAGMSSRDATNESQKSVQENASADSLYQVPEIKLGIRFDELNPTADFGVRDPMDWIVMSADQQIVN